MTDWKEYKLGDIVNFGNGKVRPKANGNIPVYGGNGILGYANEFNYTDKTIIIGRVGAYCGSVYFENKPIWVSDNALSAKPKENFNTKFLYYYLLNLKLNHHAEGSSHPLITQTLLNSIDIFITDNIVEQSTISDILSSLDDKIDLLNRQNKTLEALVETLFRQWFIEEADESWEEVTLGDFIKVKHGYAFKGTYISSDPTNLILVTPGNFKIGGGFKFDKFKYYTNNEFPAEYVFQTGDLVVTMTDLSIHGDTLGYPALIPENSSNDSYLHNQRVGKIEFKKEIGKHFIYNLMKTIDYQWFVLSGASGTAIRHTSPTSICSYTFKLPTKSLLADFENITVKLEDKIRNNHNQIRTLTQLRDTLLPKLMSGEVRVEG